MADTAVTPFTTRHRDELVPNAVAHGGGGPTLGGQVIGGLLARAIEQQVDDPDLHPARLTVDILRRVATEPVRTSASVADGATCCGGYSICWSGRSCASAPA